MIVAHNITSKAIVSDITPTTSPTSGNDVTGPDRMPGKCCFDTPSSNWEYFGQEVREENTIEYPYKQRS